MTGLEYLARFGAAAAFCLSVQAASAYEPNVYVSGGVGRSAIPDQTSVLGGVAPANLKVGFDNGVVLSGAVGTVLPYGFRLELEGGFSDNPIGDSFLSLDFGEFDSAGDVDVATIMANLLFDYDVTEEFSLFLGGGAGVAFIDLEFTRGAVNPGFVIVRGNDTRFAYQGLVGASYDITNEFEFWARYGYLGTIGSDFDAFNTGVSVVEVDVPINRHTVMIGVTAHFGLTE